MKVDGRFVWTVRETLLAAVALAAIGAFVIAEAVWVHRDVRAFQRHGLPAEATLRSIEVKHYRKSPSSYRLQLRYVAGGRPVETLLYLEGSAGERVADAPPGTVLPILYRSDEPSQVMLQAEARTKVGPTVQSLVVAIVCFTGSGVLLAAFVATRRRPARRHRGR